MPRLRDFRGLEPEASFDGRGNYYAGRAQSTMIFPGDRLRPGSIKPCAGWTLTITTTARADAEARRACCDALGLPFSPRRAPEAVREPEPASGRGIDKRELLEWLEHPDLHRPPAPRPGACRVDDSRCRRCRASAGGLPPIGSAACASAGSRTPTLHPQHDEVGSFVTICGSTTHRGLPDPDPRRRHRRIETVKIPARPGSERGWRESPDRTRLHRGFPSRIAGSTHDRSSVPLECR